ncbi:C4-dicarboxylate ABC transporter substrate-binding protein [Methylobacterium sp. ID0610]|uniref:C4-dicarboxylate ABC transporter substrate-binding protein n=1 Tax=Methylobacterium carpenticola TaxID=3344827 RepID=UPI0036B6A380
MLLRATAGLFGLAGLAVAALYVGLTHAELRVTTGPPGSALHRLIATFATANARLHPRVRLVLVEEPSLAANAEALEAGRVDLAVIRSDLSPPANGQTVAILRRDVVAVVLPPHSPVTSLGHLAGRAVAIPTGPFQDDDSRLLDTLLDYVGVPAARVERLFLDPAALGPAIREHRAAAAFAVGPIGPGAAVDAVAAVARATRGTPTLLAFDEGEAIHRRHPGLETIEVPVGAFRGQPAVPADSVNSLVVTYRLVVGRGMLDIVAAAVARSVFTARSTLTAATPFAGQIEAPDLDEKAPLVPVHPGVAAYLNNGDQSFFDTSQNYLYLGGIGLSLAGSALALAVSHGHRRRAARERRVIKRLVEIADAAGSADQAGLDALSRDLRGLVGAALREQILADGGSASLMGTAVAHAREAIRDRHGELRSAP